MIEPYLLLLPPLFLATGLGLPLLKWLEGPPALTAARGWWAARLLLSFLAGCLLLSLGAAVSLITRAPPIPVAIAVAIALWAGSRLRRQSGARAAMSKPRLNPASLERASIALWTGSALVALASLPLVLTPWNQDPQFLWFPRARVLASMSDAFALYVRSESFAHPHYPPLGAAPGALSAALGLNSDWALQSATGALTVVSALLLAWSVGRVVSTDGRAAWLGGSIPFLCLGLGKGNGFDGHLDMATALLLTCVSCLLLIRRTTREDHTALVLISWAAALIKQEGAAFLLCVVLGFVCWNGLSRGAFSKARPLLQAAGAGIAWALAVRLIASGVDPWRIGNVAPWSAQWSDRVSLIASRLLDTFPLLAAAAFAGGSLVLFLVTRSERADKRTKFAGLLLTQAGLSLALMVTIYLASPYDLHWHLRTSFQRVALFPECLIVLAGGLLFRVTRPWSRRHGAEG